MVGTSALLACNQFTRPGPSALVVLCYAAALVLISFTFRAIPMGIVYAIWSGIGMVMIVAVGWLGFGQRLDQPALVGIVLILAGVVVLNPLLHHADPWGLAADAGQSAALSSDRPRAIRSAPGEAGLAERDAAEAVLGVAGLPAAHGAVEAAGDLVVG